MKTDTVREARLPLVDPATASETLREAFQVITPINLFRAMANAESLYPAYIQYVHLLFKPLALDAGLERMIVLHVAKRSDCFYAWRQNVVVAKSVGVRQEQIDALEQDDITAKCFSERQQIAFKFTDEVIDRIEVTDATFAEAKRFFSDREITEMLYVIGTYMFIVRIQRTGRVPLDQKAAAAPS